MTSEAATRAWPVKLAFRKEARELVVSFDDGSSGAIPFRHLRANSPSAEVRGHGGGPPPPQPPIPENITVTQADPVGRYAIRIHFSDGHSSGLYTWSLLYRIAVEGDPVA
ncbi:MAG: DUF971 domain-containing protein [Pseudomonadota bacterium]